MANDQETSIAEDDKRKTREAGAHDSDDGSEDEGLALLPRYTKVRVTGNNRTKTALVGMEGIVKKAVGLGGWHWLSLSNGSEVRLQRNALSVLEEPPPDGEGLDGEDSQDDHNDDKDEGAEEAKEGGVARVMRPKRPKSSPTSGARSGPSSSSQPSPTEVNGGIRKSVGLRRLNHRKLGSPTGPATTAGKQGSSGPGGQRTWVNFNKLETQSLKRYRHHYKLEAGPNPTKDQLVSTVTQHFIDHTVDEVGVLHNFLLALQGGRSSSK